MLSFNQGHLARRMALAAFITLAAPVALAVPSAAQEIIQLWPGAAPGSGRLKAAETSRQEQSGDNRIIVTRDVSVPTMTVVRPAPGTANGTAMLVLPGGGFMGLAWDLEGTEVARWLADRGITAFILKYRVSALDLPPDQTPRDVAELMRLLEPKRKIAVIDAAQAVAIVRRDAAKYGIAPDRIGMIGFSAGAITTLGVILEGDPAKRPNFAAPIYGMTMIEAPTVPADAAPLFIVAAQDDPVIPAQSSTGIVDLWAKAKRPAELHLYAQGGHGFGMRARKLPVDHWPAALEAWLDSRGLLKPATTHPAR